MRKVFLLLAAFYIPLASAFVLRDQQQHPLSGNLGSSSELSPKRLIETAPGISSWLSEDEILQLKREHVTFFDITDGDLDGLEHLSIKTHKPPAAPKFQKIVESITNDVDVAQLETFLREFTGFHTRYYKSTYGRQSADWLFAKIRKIAKTVTEADPIKVRVQRFKHDWQQYSIIARIEPINVSGNYSTVDLPVVIVGAHQDSLNMWNPYARAPGADDDGSGTTTIFEAFRLLVESKFVPVRALEFQWYSAEEGGLLGSQKIAAAYKQHEVDVAAMIQFDMTGYQPSSRSPEVIAIGTDNVDPETTDFVRKLVKEYTAFPSKDTSCGYGCSDHASFKKAGYNSAFATEADIRDGSPYIHTSGDNIGTINFSHMKEFVKLAIAWAVEFGLDQDTL